MTEKIGLKLYYSPKEVAELLGYHPVHIRRVISKGQLPSIKCPNGSRRVAHSDLEKWVKQIGSDISLIACRFDYDPADLF